MTSFEEKPIFFLDYPFSLNAPMAKKVRTIRSILLLGKKAMNIEPCFRKRWKRRGYGSW